MSFPRPGVSTASYAATAAWAGVTGAWDAGYPVANLGDLVRPSQVARVTPAAGAAAFTTVLAADQDVQFVAPVNHTLPLGSTLRVRLYSDAAMTALAYDSAALAVWSAGAAPSARYPAVRPLVLDAPVTARAVRVDLAGLTGVTDLGACEIARFWEWVGVSPGADLGFRDPQPRLDFLGGGSQGVDEDLGRTYDGEMSLLALQVATTQGLDFQKRKGKAQPFVFLEDFLDPDTWPRTCFLATNADLPAAVGAVYRHDRFQFRLREYFR